MALEFVLVPLTLAVLLAASYTDLRKREVPDWVAYGFIFAALGTRSIFSFDAGWTVIISGLLGFAVCFLLAHLFYYTHQWGGGDSKLLMGMGAAIGISYPWNETSAQLLWFFITLLFAGAAYGIVWMGFIAVRQRHTFIPEFRERIRKYQKLHLGILVFSAIFFVVSMLHMLHFNSFWGSFWPVTFFPPVMFYLFLFVNHVEKNCFVKKIDPMNLTEGDWLAEDVMVNGKKVIRKKTLERKELTMLQNLRVKGRLKMVSVKEGIPFVPVFLLAYLITIFGKEVFQIVVSLFF